MVLAPGNYVRHEILGGQTNLSQAIILSLETLILTIGYIFKNPTFILINILFITYISSKIIPKNSVLSIEIPLIKPWIALLLSLVSILAIIFPSTLILKHLPPSRVLNFISYFIFILLTINIVNFINYYKTQIHFTASKSIQKLLIGLIFISIFSGVVVINKADFAHRNYSTLYFTGNIIKAYYVLIFEAKTFDNQMKIRNSSLQNKLGTNKTSGIIQAIEHKTSLINFINLNESNYQFNWEAKYYGLDSIYIKPISGNKQQY